MKSHIQITADPIPESIPSPFHEKGGFGSEVEFRGKIRSNEKGSTIQGLNYEAYEAMAAKEIERILQELAHGKPILSVELIHRIGWVPVGETSIYLRIRSVHRQEGFQLLTDFMNRLKQDVPIWKIG